MTALRTFPAGSTNRPTGIRTFRPEPTKEKQNQRLTLSWTEEDPEVQRWSSLKHSQQTYLDAICLMLLVITTIQCTFPLLCTQCVQVISLKTIRRTKLPCTSHNNFKTKIIQYKTVYTFYNYLDYSGYKPYRANLNVEQRADHSPATSPWPPHHQQQIMGIIVGIRVKGLPIIKRSPIPELSNHLHGLKINRLDIPLCSNHLSLLPRYL